MSENPLGYRLDNGWAKWVSLRVNLEPDLVSNDPESGVYLHTPQAHRGAPDAQAHRKLAAGTRGPHRARTG